MYFDEKLKALRLRKGLSAPELAAGLSMPEAVLDALETGFRDPGEQDLAKIAAFFAVPVQDLADDQPAVNAFSILFNPETLSGQTLPGSLMAVGLLGAGASGLTDNGSQAGDGRVLIAGFLGLSVYLDKNSPYRQPHVEAVFAGQKMTIAADGAILAGSLPPKQQKYAEAWVALRENEINAACQAFQQGKAVSKIKGLDT
jgi:hypothetical protein